MHRKANETLEEIAAARNIPTAAIYQAWLLRRSPALLFIPGTHSFKHLEVNTGAAAFNKTDTEFAELGAVVPNPCRLCG